MMNCMPLHVCSLLIFDVLHVRQDEEKRNG
jgi:hypothetical protein